LINHQNAWEELEDQALRPEVPPGFLAKNDGEVISD
jgi:hypothetical protein